MTSTKGREISRELRRAYIGRAILESVGDGERVRDSLLQVRAFERLNQTLVNRTPGRLPFGWGKIIDELRQRKALKKGGGTISLPEHEPLCVYSVYYEREEDYASVLSEIRETARRGKNMLTMEDARGYLGI